MFSALQDTPPSVLIVDDAPDNLDLLQRLLADEAYEIRVAPNGEFALRAMEANPPRSDPSRYPYAGPGWF